jgi:aminoglycoside phosphotransferase (APT) family kinase protein
MDLRQPFIADGPLSEPATQRVETHFAAALIATRYERAMQHHADELEREGQPVVLVCLDRTTHAHETSRADVLHMPLISAGVASSLAQRFARDPRKAAALFRLGTRAAAAAAIAQALERRGITSVRGLDPAGSKIASLVSESLTHAQPDLSELCVDWSRLGARVLGIRWMSLRINSFAAEVTLDGDKRVVVKRHRDHAGGSANSRWKQETHALHAMRELLGDGAVPAILLADERSSVIVMERAAGVPLETLFAAGRQDELEQALRGAGAWLAAMQKGSAHAGDPTPIFGRILSDATRHLSVLAARDRGIRRRRDELARTLDQLATRVAARTTVLTAHHGDFIPGNIFVDGTRATVIDFESCREGFPLEDVAYFLLRLDLLRRRYRIAEDLEEVFLRAYGAGSIDAEALRLFTMTKGLWTLAIGIGDDQPQPQRMWIRASVRRRVMDALRSPAAARA